MKILYIEDKADIENLINNLNKTDLTTDAYAPVTVVDVDYVVAPLDIWKNAFTPTKFLVIGSLKINLFTNEVLVKDTLVSLSRREYDLLVYISKSAPRIVTTSNICTCVWKEHCGLLSNTIEVHINKLNKKLGAKYIKCVKGFGYKFISN
jgi:hypothetical protein